MDSTGNSREPELVEGQRTATRNVVQPLPESLRDRDSIGRRGWRLNLDVSEELIVFQWAIRLQRLCRAYQQGGMCLECWETPQNLQLL